MAKHHDADEVPQPQAGREVTQTVTLAEGDTAWMPGTTKHVFHGPKVITYRVFPDGGVQAEVDPPRPSPKGPVHPSCY